MKLTWNEAKTIVTDENNNSATIHYHFSKENAENSLKTLVNCRNCTDCANCRNCMYCANCANCMNCTDCMNCTGCMNCMNCMNCTDCTDCRNCMNLFKIKKCENSSVSGPFRSDGYQFAMSEKGSIHAGCRVFENMKQARKHWSETRGGTPLGDETMKILDFMEKVYQHET